MEILGQIGDKVYVADVDHNVLYATTPPDETVELVNDGRTTPDQFLKFNGAYLTDLAADRDEEAIIDAVERDADQMPPPLPESGTAPTDGAQVFVAGVLTTGGDSRVRILSASPERAVDATSVWLEGNPGLVTTKADIDADHVAGWMETPTPV